MSFGNPGVFPFPAVQYIPMTITSLQQGKLLNCNLKTPVLVAGAEILNWQQIFASNFHFTEQSTDYAFPILALNLEVTSVKYRGIFVTMLGQKKSGSYQLFTVPKRYFYKPNLYFQVFDEFSHEVLAKYSQFKPQTLTKF